MRGRRLVVACDPSEGHSPDSVTARLQQQGLLVARVLDRVWLVTITDPRAVLQDLQIALSEAAGADARVLIVAPDEDIMSGYNLQGAPEDFAAFSRGG